jgi:hypothetical protein
MEPQKNPALIHDDSEWMKIILSVLNGRDRVRAELRRLVAAWDDAGRDVEKMLAGVPELNPYLYDQDGYPSWRVAFVPEGSGFRLVLNALESKGSGLYLIPRAHVPDVPATTDEERTMYWARETFMRLLFNELRDYLAGPCQRKQCDKYWLRKRARVTAYCSRRCCQLASATKYTRDRLEAEHKDKLKRAKAAIQTWRTARKVRDDWKTFVSKQEPDITPKFLTRAVNKGELKPPKKGGK